MYAIIETGGKQYRVTPGDVLSVEKLGGDVGNKLTFDKLLLVGGKTNNQTLVGTPFVPSARVEAEIVAHTKGDKIRIIKYKRRKGYRRMLGHRQIFTRLLVLGVDDGAGEVIKFDETKRNDVLKKASIPFSTRAEERQKKATVSVVKK